MVPHSKIGVYFKGAKPLTLNRETKKDKQKRNKINFKKLEETEIVQEILEITKIRKVKLPLIFSESYSTHKLKEDRIFNEALREL